MKKNLINKGIFINSFGVRYEGNFLNNKKHGWGKLINQRGYEDEGFWLNDRLIRKQNYFRKFSNGDVFYQTKDKSGILLINAFWFCLEVPLFFKINLLGSGVYTWADGRIYEGLYYNNKRNGQGFYNYLSKK